MKNMKIMAVLLTFLIGGLSGMARSEEDNAPKNDVLLPELIRQREELSIFSKLLQETGWADSLLRSVDESYVPVSEVPSKVSSVTFPVQGFAPPQKPIAYTVFAECDSVFAAYGISDAATLTAYLQEHYGGEYMYGDLLYDDQYTDERHVANRFVSYHLLPQKLWPEQLVYHYNENDFDLDDYLATGIAKPTVPIYDYYATMGTPQRLLKVYESKESQGVRLNRIVTFKQDVYEEDVVKKEGLLISKAQMDSALNGNVYFLNDLLVYDEWMSYAGLGQERLRFDLSSISPELMNLGYRRIMNSSARAVYLVPDFLSNIKSLAGNLYYLPGFRSNWSDYQGDELLLVSENDNLDVLIMLPPVPADGTYQLRLGLSGNPYRSVVQYYVGGESAIWPMGLPVDERTQNNNEDYKKYGLGNPSFVDENLLIFHGGHMKAPGIFSKRIPYKSSIGRRIIGEVAMNADQKYYLRIKSMIKSEMQLFLDYIELVPSAVYNNPSQPEDPW